ncbi:GTPase Der [Linum grandiflorum]
MVVDTGGVIPLSKSKFEVMEELAITTTIGMEGIPLATREAAISRMPSMIERQATAAVEEASAIIFLVDGQAGLTAADVEIADWLRKYYSHKFVILAVNKCESPRKGLMQVSDFWTLGFSPIPISAISGTGTGELLNLASDEEEEKEDYVPSISIVGRPNVGKSSILNALVGEDRTIVSPVSGTTRDAIDTEFTGPDGQKCRLIDTAGIRKRTAVASAGSTTEALSVNHAFRAIRRSDVVALVIEAMACITEQGLKTGMYYLRSRAAADAIKFTVDTTDLKDKKPKVEAEDDGDDDDGTKMAQMAGLTAADVEIADWLRKYYSHKFVILAVNKCESPRKGLIQVSDFWTLGFSPIPISAISGTGTGELLLNLVCSEVAKPKVSHSVESQLCSMFVYCISKQPILYPSDEEEEKEDYVPSISIVGRPNVGKSSILNALVGEDRTIVSPVSGTTRDAIDTEFTGPDGQKFRLIDTAGIRKRTAVASAGSSTEALSVNHAFRAIRRSDVVALVIEALACITEQVL